MESLLRISLLFLLVCGARSYEEAPNIILVLTDDQDMVLKGLVCIRRFDTRFSTDCNDKLHRIQ